MNSSVKPYSILRLHQSCCNFAILEQTRDFELFYKCASCNLNLHPRETIDMDDYLKIQKGQEINTAADKSDNASFLPFQIVTFTKNKEVRTPIAANEFIVYDKTNHREIFFCPACKVDRDTILIPNNLRDLSFKRICETCKYIS